MPDGLATKTSRAASIFVRAIAAFALAMALVPATSLSAVAEELTAEEPVDASSATVTLASTSFVYSGEAKKPDATVTLGGVTLAAGTDYTLAYSGNTAIGTAYVTVTFTGDYTGTASASFTIVPAKVTVKSATTALGNKVVVKWKKASGGVSGYDIRYRKKGAASWKSATAGSTATSATLKGLKAGKKYQVQVRAYKSVSGSRYTGSWSASETVDARYDRTIKVGGAKKLLQASSGTWVKKKGYTYFKLKTSSGSTKLAKKTFVNVKGSVYYFDKKGRMCTSWHKIGSDYYFFNRSSGKMASGKKVEKVKLTTYGTAKKSSINLKRVDVYISAREMMEGCTKATDSKAAKLKKCFKALFPYPYKQYRKLKYIYKTANWELTFANDIFKHHAGCCVSLAAAFAYLARECGYMDVYIGHDTGHAWTMVNGYVYDPLFAEARGWSANYHAKSKSDYRSSVPYKRAI